MGQKSAGKQKGKLPKSNVRSLPAVVAGPPFAVSLMSLSHYKFSSHLDTYFAAAWLGGGRGGRGGRGNFLILNLRNDRQKSTDMGTF